MANIVWNGSTGQLTLGANWVGAAAPGAGDVAVFNRGSQDVDPGLGNIAAMQGIEIYPGYGGTIGGTGNKMTSSVDTIKHLGRAEFWFDDAAGTTDDVFIRTVDRNVIVNLGGVTMTKVHILRGNVTLDGTTGVIALLKVGFVDNVQQDVMLNIVTNGNAITLGKIDGGVITLNKEMVTTDISDGLITVPVGSSGDMGTIYMGGGVIRHNTLATIDAAYVGAATLDLGQEAKTVTLLVRYPKSKVIKNDILHTITAEHNIADVD